MQCSCLVSLFNCLSFCGLRESVIKYCAFSPPTNTLKNQNELMLLPSAKPFEIAEPRASPSQEFFSQGLCYFSMRNGQKNYGILFQNLKEVFSQKKERNVILFSHGNATEITEMQGIFITLCLKLEVDVFAYEYTGYGMMERKVSPSEEALLYNVEAAYYFLREKGYEARQIIVYFIKEIFCFFIKK